MEFKDLVNISLIIGLIIFLTNYLFGKQSVRRRKIHAIPGLKNKNPKTGHLQDIQKRGGFVPFLEYIHRKYGPLVSFYMNETRVISLSHHKYFKAIQHLSDRPKIFFQVFQKMIGEDSIQFANGENWWNRRKVYDRSFSHAVNAKFLSTIAKITQRWLASQKRAADGDNSVIVMEDCARECLLLSGQSVVMSHIDPSLLEDGNDVFERLLGFYSVVWDCAEKTLSAEVGEDKMDEDPITMACQGLKSITRDIVRARRLMHSNISSEIEAKELRVLIDNIIGFNGADNDRVIESDVLTMVVGGMHTTGNTFSWCLYYLARYKSVQDKLFESLEEFRSAPGGVSLMLLGGYIETARKIRESRYLSAVISETLRVSQVVSIATRVSQSQPVSLRCHQEKTVGGFTDHHWEEIPAGTPILLALGVAMHDPTVFLDPLVFRPDRFLPPQPPLPPLAFEPFGFAGKRRCPADKFSTLEMSVWLIMLVTQFEMELLEPDQEVKQVYRLVTHMDRAVGLRLVPRSMKRDIAATTASTADPQTAQQ